MSVSDCVWYLRATSIEDRRRWIDALELAKRSHLSLIADQNGIGRYDSAMSLASASSLRKSGHNLKEKLAEMETFKDILSQQIDKLGAHIEQYGKSTDVSNHLSGVEADKLSPMDFKAEAITFKATANGVLFSLATCIEIFSRSEEHWRKKLEKEQVARRRAEEKFRLAVRNNGSSSCSESSSTVHSFSSSRNLYPKFNLPPICSVAITDINNIE